LAQKGKAVFTIAGKGFDLASIVMLLGGLFLIYKSVKEIHAKLEGEDPNAASANKPGISLGNAIGQIMLIDAVFSFDSIITAGGTAKHLEIMVAAVVIAMTIMFLFSPKIAAFIHKHPTLNCRIYSQASYIKNAGTFFFSNDWVKPCNGRLECPSCT